MRLLYNTYMSFIEEEWQFILGTLPLRFPKQVPVFSLRIFGLQAVSVFSFMASPGSVLKR